MCPTGRERSPYEFGETITGTPQGGILSPLLANIALSVLDEHFTHKWEALGPEWTRVKALRAEVDSVLAPIGLALSEAKTRVCHIDEGSDFLGWRIQRRSWRGRTGKKAVHTYPSKQSLRSIMDRVRWLTRRRRHRTLADLLRRLNPMLRGWCNYFRHGVSSHTFGYLDHFVFWRIVGWLKKRHVGLNMHTLVRRYLPRWEIRDGRIELLRPRTVAITRYRYRGAQIPTPWTSTTNPLPPAA